MSNWKIYNGHSAPHDGISRLPEPPPWRAFKGEVIEHFQPENEDSDKDQLISRGKAFQIRKEEVELVNAALLLRRPLLVTGKPGSGKSSLAYSIAYELKLGPVLRWSITTRSSLAEGLYNYDAIARLQDASPKDDSNKATEIGKYIRLGPLGTALLPVNKPRVLLIDEIDKSDIDLPNDLLHVFEEGEFDIHELVRYSKETETKSVDVYYSGSSDAKVSIQKGKVRCREFPFVILTSNGEREFPPAFLRRCIRLDMKLPERDMLTNVVRAHFDSSVFPAADQLIDDFIKRRDKENKELATDQLLNAIYLTTNGVDRSKKEIFDAIMRQLSQADSV